MTRADVEDTLYGYSTLDRDIAELEQELRDMMPNYSTSIVVFDHNVGGDQTSKQERFITSRRYERISGKLGRLKHLKTAMNGVRKQLTHRELMILDLKYGQLLPEQYISKVLGCSIPTYHRHKNILLEKAFYALEGKY